MGILNLYFIQLGIGDMFADSSLPDSEISNTQLDMLSPTGDLKSPIGDNMPNLENFLLVVYSESCCIPEFIYTKYIAIETKNILPYSAHDIFFSQNIRTNCHCHTNGNQICKSEFLKATAFWISLQDWKISYEKCHSSLKCIFLSSFEVHS